eukprot:768035-Hanusia_phi.AAC.3
MIRRTVSSPFSRLFPLPFCSSLLSPLSSLLSPLSSLLSPLSSPALGSLTLKSPAAARTRAARLSRPPLLCQSSLQLRQQMKEGEGAAQASKSDSEHGKRRSGEG